MASYILSMPVDRDIADLEAPTGCTVRRRRRKGGIPGRPKGGRTVRLGTIRVHPEVAQALEESRGQEESLTEQVERILAGALGVEP